MSTLIKDCTDLYGTPKDKNEYGKFRIYKTGQHLSPHIVVGVAGATMERTLKYTHAHNLECNVKILKGLFDSMTKPAYISKTFINPNFKYEVLDEKHLHIRFHYFGDSYWLNDIIRSYKEAKKNWRDFL